jgi:Zn-dependent M28 family amino/carboxypeptidase
MDHLRKLSVGIGVRVAGSEGEERAVDYISRALFDLGYYVEEKVFTFEDDPFKTATVSTASATIDAFTMRGSTGGRGTGPAVFVGRGDVEGYRGKDVKGKVAVAERGGALFKEKAERARDGGATALIVINNADEDLLGNLSGRLNLPVVGVSRTAREALLDLAQKGETVTVTAAGGDSTTATNVLARSAKGDRCRVLVGGHLDTVPGTPGAHDNASGTAAVLELARAFAADGLDKGLCFAAFSAEESGLHGSNAMAEDLQAAGELPPVMVNLDTIGVGTRLDLIGTAALTARALAIAQELNLAAQVVQLGANFGSDHQSFERAGSRVLFIATNDFSTIHKPGDTIDTISATLIEAAGDLAYAAITVLLNEAG